ncbi:hypothetical protein ACYOEI_38725, partial [Singulisphaera rosea]
MMETQIWCKTQEKWANILILRGNEVSSLKVSGMSITLKGKVQGVLDALGQGQDPAEVKAKLQQTLDVRAIGKAVVSPGNSSLTLHGEGEGAPKVEFAPAEDNADEILRTILARSGRTYQPAQEEIGVVEALIPPALLGVVGGIIWGLIYHTAGELASGVDVEVNGVRRRGLQRILITIAGILGTNGSIAVGVLLLLLVVGWAAKRVVHRPE